MHRERLCYGSLLRAREKVYHISIGALNFYFMLRPLANYSEGHAELRASDKVAYLAALPCSRARSVHKHLVR